MRRLRHRVMLRLGPGAAFFLIKCLQWTMSIEELNGERIKGLWERGENIIGAFWHGRLLMAPLVYGGRGIKILTSRHRDGELISRTIHRFGLGTIRGSSTVAPQRRSDTSCSANLSATWMIASSSSGLNAFGSMESMSISPKISSPARIRITNSEDIPGLSWM